MILSKLLWLVPGAVLLAAVVGSRLADPASGLRFSVTFTAAKSATPLDGRLLVMLSKDKAAEPRTQISDSTLKSQQVFGVDADGWKAGTPTVIAGDVLGYPVESLAAIPPGTYQVQALLHRYETFRVRTARRQAANGSRRGPAVEQGPGNLYSTPKEITDRSGQGPRRSRSTWIKSSRRFPTRPRRSTSGTSGSRRAAHEVLGPPDVPRRARARSRGLRRSPQRALSAGHQPRALPRHDRRLPRDPAGSQL